MRYTSSVFEGLSIVLREAWKRPKYRAIMIVVALISALAAVATGAFIAHAANVTASPAVTSGQAASSMSILGKAIGAGLAVGLAGIGGGYAVGVAGAAAISAVAEKREVFGSAFLFVVLGEGIAIYGLLIAIIIAFVLPTTVT